MELVCLLGRALLGLLTERGGEGALEVVRDVEIVE
jgi:hypothetical protein